MCFGQDTAIPFRLPKNGNFWLVDWPLGDQYIIKDIKIH